MACADQLGKLDLIYVIILLLCLLLLVRPHVNWKTKATARTRKTVSVVSKQTIQAAKAPQLPNITQLETCGSNDIDTYVDTCCSGVNSKLVSLSNEVF